MAAKIGTAVQTIGRPPSTIGAIAMNSKVEDGMLIAAPGSGEI